MTVKTTNCSTHLISFGDLQLFLVMPFHIITELRRTWHKIKGRERNDGPACCYILSVLCEKSVTVFSVLEPDLIYSVLFNIVQGVKEELNYIPIWLYSGLCCHGNVKCFFL